MSIERDLSEVYPGLFLSSVYPASDDGLLKSRGITHIINLSGLGNLHPTEFVYYRIDIDDRESENIAQYFKPAIEFIMNAMLVGGKVLIHCAAGVSRSPTIVMAYLIDRHNFTPATALKYVRERRPVVDPNLGFRRQLVEFAGDNPGS